MIADHRQLCAGRRRQPTAHSHGDVAATGVVGCRPPCSSALGMGWDSGRDGSPIVNVTQHRGRPRASRHGDDPEFDLWSAVGRHQGGPQVTFDEAVSFQVICETQGRPTTTGNGCPKAARNALRLAQGRVRVVLAGRTGRYGGAVDRSGPAARSARHEGDARDGQARHRNAARRGGGCRPT